VIGLATWTLEAIPGKLPACWNTGQRYLVGVQCHPEELAESQPGMQRLFTDFLAAASAWSH
jgi:gamma-glutamyl-gamma-aminobutyrate hydrolase PuuD